MALGKYPGPGPEKEIKFYKDKNGNEPEEGGKVIFTDTSYRVIRCIIGDILFGDGALEHSCTTFYLPELIKAEVTFEPKPEEPKRVTPPDGIPVKVLKECHWIVRISSGELDEDGYLICYPNGKLSGVCSDHGWKEWGLIE